MIIAMLAVSLAVSIAGEVDPHTAQETEQAEPTRGSLVPLIPLFLLPDGVQTNRCGNMLTYPPACIAPNGDLIFVPDTVIIGEMP